MGQCIDCAAEGNPNRRKVYIQRNGKPAPGNRCGEHFRVRRDERAAATREKRWMERYGISVDEYDAIYEAQGGLCYICRRANGKVRKLAVDHDHQTGYVRGLLCKSCNRGVLGHARDEVEFFERAISYLQQPPAFGVIGKRIAPVHLKEAA